MHTMNVKRWLSLLLSAILLLLPFGGTAEEFFAEEEYAAAEEFIFAAEEEEEPFVQTAVSTEEESAFEEEAPAEEWAEVIAEEEPEAEEEPVAIEAEVEEALPETIEEALEEAITNVSNIGAVIVVNLYGGGTTEYTVYRSVNGGTYVEDTDLKMTGSNPATTVQWTDEDIVPGSSYKYLIHTPSGIIPETASVTVGTKYVTHVEAKAVSSGIEVTWNAYPGAGQYKIYRATSAGSDDTWTGMTLMGTAIGTKWTDTGAAGGVTYYYRVFADGKTTLGAEAHATAGSAPATIGQVTGVTARPEYTNSARITWDAVPGANGYQLMRADTEDGTYTWVKNNPTTTVVNYVLNPGADYWYKVRAYYEAGDGSRIYGPYSVAAKAHIPGRITGFSVRGLDTNAAKLTWDSVPGVTGYQVFRTVANTGGNYTWVKNNSTSQVGNYGLTPGTVYYYKVRAYVDNPDGTRAYGEYSEAKNVRILDAVSLNGLTFNGNIILNWTSAIGQTGYQVLYTVAGTGGVYEWAFNTAGSVTTGTFTKWIYGKDYYFKVRAYKDNDDGSRCYGQFSDGKHCAAQYNLTTPVMTKAELLNEGLKISWQKVTDADGLELYYRANGSGSFTKLAEPPIVTAEYLWNGFTVGAGYEFYIRSYKNGSGGTRYYGGDSNVVSCTAVYNLTTPVMLTAEASLEGLKLTWQQVTDADGLEIYYRAGGIGSFQKLTDAAVSATEYNWTGYATGTNYEFFMKSYKSGTGGARYYSSDSNIITCATAMTAPTMRAVYGERGSGNKAVMYVSWNDLTGINQWEIQYNPGSGWLTYANVTENTPGDLKFIYNNEDHGLQCGVTYSFRVRGVFTLSGMKRYTEWSTAMSGSMPKLRVYSATTASESSYAYVKISNYGTQTVTAGASCIVYPQGLSVGSYNGALATAYGTTAPAGTTVTLRYKTAGVLFYNKSQQVYFTFTYSGHEYRMNSDTTGPDGYGFWTTITVNGRNSSGTHS